MMAYYPCTLVSIIFLSYYIFIQTFAVSIAIKDSSYKLSTEVQYAIYERYTNDFMGDGNPTELDGKCSFDIYNYDITDPKKNNNFKWTIEATKTGHALKNVGTGRYLSVDPAGSPDDNRYCSNSDGTFITSILSPYDKPYYSFTFEYNKDAGNINYNSQSLPVVTIKEASNEGELIAAAFMYEHCDRNPSDKLRGNKAVYHYTKDYWVNQQLFDLDPNCIAKRGWVFIPLSLPSNCESITTDPSTPDALKSLTSQISSSLSTSITNAGSFEVPYSTPERTECKEFTTTFTRTQGSEASYGFSIEYESPELSIDDVLPLGQFSAEYHMEWKYYQETENTRTDTNTACISFPSVDSACPPRTICERVVTTYKPPLSNIEFTINAICDGNTYTTKGLASVDGIVRIEYIDQSLPMDCPYYTTNYNLFEPGTLQFCDTCNNDKTCEICRDGYILLDGVCITEATCEVICGGTVRGGKYLEILGGLGPWSGGFCQIDDHNKYLSDSCRAKLGGANAEQNNVTPTPVITPSSTDNPSNGEECVGMYEQCGGIGYSGPSNCCQYNNDQREWKCTYISDWHSQCNPF